MNSLDKNNMHLKNHLLNISKLQTACFYRKKLKKSYKLLNMTALKKTLCKFTTGV